jgi:hypothetical protein
MHLENNYKRESDGEKAPEERRVVSLLVPEASVPAGLFQGAVWRECQREVDVTLQLPVVFVLVQQLGQEFRRECDQESLCDIFYKFLSSEKIADKLTLLMTAKCASMCRILHQIPMFSALSATVLLVSQTNF